MTKAEAAPQEQYWELRDGCAAMFTELARGHEALAETNVADAVLLYEQLLDLLAMHCTAALAVSVRAKAKHPPGKTSLAAITTHP